MKEIEKDNKNKFWMEFKSLREFPYLSKRIKSLLKINTREEYIEYMLGLDALNHYLKLKGDKHILHAKKFKETHPDYNKEYQKKYRQKLTAFMGENGYRKYRAKLVRRLGNIKFLEQNYDLLWESFNMPEKYEWLRNRSGEVKDVIDVLKLTDNDIIYIVKVIKIYLNANKKGYKFIKYKFMR